MKKWISKVWRSLVEGTFNKMADQWERIPMGTKFISSAVIAIALSAVLVFCSDAIVFVLGSLAFLPPALTTYVFTYGYKESAPRWADKWLLWGSIYGYVAMLVYFSGRVMDIVFVVIMVIAAFMYISAMFGRREKLLKQAGEIFENAIDNTLDTQDSQSNSEPESVAVDSDSTAG